MGSLEATSESNRTCLPGVGVDQYSLIQTSNQSALVPGYGGALCPDSVASYHDLTTLATRDGAHDALLPHPGRRLNWPVLGLFLIVIFAIGGNILVCLAVKFERKLQNMFNFFLVSLALSDMLSATLIMPLSIVKAFDEDLAVPKYMCLAWYSLDVLFTSSTIIHLCMISIDRYVSLQYPLRYGHSKKTTTTVGKIVLVWVISFCIAGPLFLLSMFDNDSNVHYKGCGPETPIFVVSATVTSFYLPLLIMTVMYALTVRALRRQLKEQRRMAVTNSGASSSLSYSRDDTTGGGSFYGRRHSPSFLRAVSSKRKTLHVTASSPPPVTAPPSPSSSHNSGSTSHTSTARPFRHSFHHFHHHHSDNQTSTPAPYSNSLTLPVPADRSLTHVNDPKEGARTDPHTPANKASPSLCLTLTTCANHGNMTCTPTTTTTSASPSPPTSPLANKNNTKKVPVPGFLSPHSSFKLPRGSPYLDQAGSPSSGSSHGDLSACSHASIPGSPSGPRNGSLTSPAASQKRRLRVRIFRFQRNASTTDSGRRRRALNGPDRGRRAVQVLGILFAVFVVFYLPFFALYVIRTTCRACTPYISPQTIAALEWLEYSGAMVNPIIYHIFNPDFRRAFQKLLRCKCH